MSHVIFAIGLLLTSPWVALASDASVHKDLEKMIARVDNSRFDANYGTMLLFHADRKQKKLYYLINNHAVPYQGVVNEKFSAIVGILDDQIRPIGIDENLNAPTRDLTVGSLDISEEETVEVLLDEAERLISHYYPERSQQDSFKHVGFLGVLGRVLDNRLAYKNLTIGMEVDAAYEAREIGRPLQAVMLFSSDPEDATKYLSYHLTKIVKTKWDCPPVNLEYCFQIPMRSAGFSGGAFLTSDSIHIDSLVKIAGMVSYYSPGLAKTTIIPIEIAIDTGLQLLGLPKTFGSAPMSEDPLAYDVAGCYTIRAGDLAGTKVSHPNVEDCEAQNDFYSFVATGGGGNGLGGGGNGLGGGGNGLGGGGNGLGGGGLDVPSIPVGRILGDELEGRYPAGLASYWQRRNRSEDPDGWVLFNDIGGNLVGYGDFDRIVSDLADPSKWGDRRRELSNLLTYDRYLRGLDSYLRLRSGFVLGDNLYPDHDFNEFLQCYRRSASKLCLDDPLNKNILPDLVGAKLSIHPSHGYGFETVQSFESTSSKNFGKLLDMQKAVYFEMFGTSYVIPTHPEFPKFGPIVNATSLLHRLMLQADYAFNLDVQEFPSVRKHYKNIFDNSGKARSPLVDSLFSSAEFEEGSISLKSHPGQDGSTFVMRFTIQKTLVQGSSKIMIGDFSFPDGKVPYYTGGRGLMVISYDRANNIVDLAFGLSDVLSKEQVIANGPAYKDYYEMFLPETGAAAARLAWNHLPLALDGRVEELFQENPNVSLEVTEFFTELPSMFPATDGPRLNRDEVLDMYEDLFGYDFDRSKGLSRSP